MSPRAGTVRDEVTEMYTSHGHYAFHLPAQSNICETPALSRGPLYTCPRQHEIWAACRMRTAAVAFVLRYVRYF